MDKTNRKRIKKEEVYLLLFTILILAFQAIRIGNDSISGDEGFSLMLLKMDVPTMIKTTAADVHPPLYYLLYQFFALFGGYSAIAGRVFSYLAIVLAAVLANTYLKKRFGIYAAAIFLVLLTFTGNCMEMIVEIRMYTWSMLFVTLTALFAYELMRTPRSGFYPWAGFSICSLAAAYSHYYALIMVAFIYLFLYVVLIARDKKNIIPCLLSGFVAVVAYFPWLLVLLKQFDMVSQDYWISNIDIKECIRYVFGSNRFGKLLRLILALSAFIYLFTQDGLHITHQKEKTDQAFLRFDWQKIKHWDADRLLVLLCGIVTVGTLAVGIGVSYLFRPLYVVRYLYSAMGLVCLAFGIAFTGCSTKRIYAQILIIAVLLFGLPQLASMIKVEKAYQTEETKEYFAQHLQPGDAIITNDAMISWTLLAYYFPNHQTSHMANYDLLTEQYTTAWYMNTGKEVDKRIAEYEAKGLTVTYVMDSGIGRYPYALYRITK
ncbi:MAG: glycosyltransferase family 39 protein [Lachnospiraceae bacterium]